MNNNFSYLTAKMQETSGTLLVTVLRLLTHKLAVLTVPQRKGVLAQNVFKFQFHTLTIFISVNHITKHLKYKVC